MFCVCVLAPYVPYPSSRYFRDGYVDFIFEWHFTRRARTMTGSSGFFANFLAHVDHAHRTIFSETVSLCMYGRTKKGTKTTMTTPPTVFKCLKCMVFNITMQIYIFFFSKYNVVQCCTPCFIFFLFSCGF